jgi:drug/metabolite transporter (DMT)-like permease
VLIVGISAGVVYLVTFAMIQKVGAGLFSLFDYGLAPLLTGAIGIVFLGNTLTRRLLLASLAYVAGIFLLFWGNQKASLAWIAIAVLSPIGTAISDATTKWLLSPERGDLSRSELLFLRFLPATILIGIWITSQHDGIHIHNGPASLALGIIFGFLPLWLLCTGLGRAALTKYAVWEFLIPAVAFFATLPLHAEHQKLTPVVGALVILLAVVLHEIKWPTKLRKPGFVMFYRNTITLIRARPTISEISHKKLPVEHRPGLLQNRER